MEGNEANNNNANSNQNAQNTTGQNNNANQPNNNSNGIDYNKIQEIIEGRNAKTEDSVLKAYFQKQGLSPEEMESAINAFKTQKANQANAQNKELTDTQASLQKVQLENQRLKIEKKAYDFVDDLNVDNKTMPYLLKMADFNNCIGKDGNVLEDTLKAALQKVVDDVPGLKKQVQGVVGITVGADTNNGTNSNNGVFDFGFTGVRPRKK
ncbi:MAG: hypothetical protein Q4C11_01615 [Clostridium sp.]|jgi:hypothetical protein|nr:hypothetical protein [Clostridium sp.]DAL31508.1 MAG TPA_asm: hypothetical protein [Caudoviricetes sp.]